MSKFKVGDKVRCVDNSSFGVSLTVGKVYVVEEYSPCPSYVRIKPNCTLDVGSYSVERFELVTDSVLTPEEVFEHLRKGVKLQRQLKDVSSSWVNVDPYSVYVHQIDDYSWRIKPEPEVIELNGKKYREVVE